MPAEIVVADQSSNHDGGLASVAEGTPCEIVHLRLTSAGVSRARNAGIRAARHDLLVFTDDDVRVEPDWLECIVAGLELEPPRSVVTGLVLRERDDDRRWFTPSVSSRSDRESRHKPVIRVIVDRSADEPLIPLCLAVRRAAFEDVGLFDERLGPGTAFPGAEDNDLGFRLLEAGYRIVVRGDAVVSHRAWRTRRDLVPVGWRYGLGQGAFYAKHGSRDDRPMRGRLRGYVSWRLRRASRLLLPRPRQSLADVANVAGVLVGATRWKLRYGTASEPGEPRLPSPERDPT